MSRGPRTSGAPSSGAARRPGGPPWPARSPKSSERIGFILLALVIGSLVIPEIGLAIGGALGWGLTAALLLIAIGAQVWTYARFWGSRPSG